jgi:hypothetical protein
MRAKRRLSGDGAALALYSTVIPGLVPGIHVAGRNKFGRDDKKVRLNPDPTN